MPTKFSSHPAKMANELVIEVMQSSQIKAIESEIKSTTGDKAKAEALLEHQFTVNQSALPRASFLFGQERDRRFNEISNYAASVKKQINSDDIGPNTLVQKSVEYVHQEQYNQTPESYFNNALAPQLNDIKRQKNDEYDEQQKLMMTFLTRALTSYTDCIRGVATRHGDANSTEKELKKARQDAIARINKIQQEIEKELEIFKKADFDLLKSPEYYFIIKELEHLHAKGLALIKSLQDPDVVGDEDKCKERQKDFEENVIKILSNLDEGFERVKETQSDHIDQFNFMLKEELKKFWYMLSQIFEKLKSNNPEEVNDAKNDLATLLKEAVDATSEQQQLIHQKAWSTTPLIEEAKNLNATYEGDYSEAVLTTNVPTIKEGLDSSLMGDPNSNNPKLETAKNHVSKPGVTVEYRTKGGSVIRCERNDEGKLTMKITQGWWETQNSLLDEIERLSTTVYAAEFNNNPITITGRNTTIVAECKGRLAAHGVSSPAEVVEARTGIRKVLSNVGDAIKRMTPGLTPETKGSYSPEFYQARNDSIARRARKYRQEGIELGSDVRDESLRPR